MRYPWIDEYLMSLPGVEKDFKAEWNWERYMIDGKLFAAVCLDDGTHKPALITLKLEPAEGELMRSQYPDIIPGYYMNKIHWNSVRAEGSVPDDLLRTLLERSWLLVLSGLSKKRQREILG